VHQRHTVDALDLQAVEEALHHRIIDAVASAADAGNQSVAIDQVAMISATVNAAAIHVHDHAAELVTPGKHQRLCVSGVNLNGRSGVRQLNWPVGEAWSGGALPGSPMMRFLPVALAV
jgi:hypothetical protein